MISNDVALFLQKTLKQVRRSSPPENACGVSVSIKVGHIDADLKNENYESDDMGITPIDFRNHFDFYFNGIKEHLSKSFKEKNLGFSSKELRNKNIYRFQAGAKHQYVSPAGTVVIARDFNKKTYEPLKEHWGVDEPKDKDLEEPQRCDFSIFSDIVWVISEPKNNISGFVNNVDKNGNKEKLTKGKVKFTRLGPNNGSQTKFESKINEGYYKTEPKLPSGHYKVELTEPDKCAKMIEENWIFTSGNMMTKSFDVTCKENDFFTITTSKKTTTTVKPIENYRGISTDLKAMRKTKTPIMSI